MGLCALSVVLGYALRETGTAVTIRTLRHRAYGDVASGIQALMDGDYAVASDHLVLALRVDPSFPEAHLALSLARLGTGDTVAADEHARLAARFAELGLLDKFGGVELGDGTVEGFGRLATQIQCVASVLDAPLPLLEARRLLSVFADLSRPDRCQIGLRTLMLHPDRPAHRRLQRALAACPQRFHCPESVPDEP